MSRAPGISYRTYNLSLNIGDQYMDNNLQVKNNTDEWV